MAAAWFTQWPVRGLYGPHYTSADVSLSLNRNVTYHVQPHQPIIDQQGLGLRGLVLNVLKSLGSPKCP